MVAEFAEDDSAAKVEHLDLIFQRKKSVIPPVCWYKGVMIGRCLLLDLRTM